MALTHLSKERLRSTSSRATGSVARRVGIVLLAAATLAAPRIAAAAEGDASSTSVAGVIRGVVLDPTTYAPALISHDATMRDWQTSQALFAMGFREWNERFTVSGLPNDVPVSYEVGRRRILKDALVTFQMSALNALAVRTTESLLVDRYPEHRRLIKTFGWIERIASASLISYRLSASHYQQARQNTALAQSLTSR